MASVVNADNKGLRFNEGKPRYDLLPYDAIDALADHYRKGSEKYAERNWERGMDWSKCFSSLMRHASAFAQGEDYDPENGSLHATAMAWNALALLAYQLRNIGNDDRPNSQARNQAQEPHSQGPTEQSFVPYEEGSVQTC
jgi:dATP/dGTP diphosphohydrolase